MAIHFIPNDPQAGPSAPGLRTQPKRRNRLAGRASFTFSGAPAEKVFQPGTAEFLFWQSREAALAALEAWESAAGPFRRWQGDRKRLDLFQDAGEEVNAFYDRDSFSFFHQQIDATTTVFSGASTDVVAHEVGHGLLDSVRPELWAAPFLEVGAFHEAFGDCLAILTSLSDAATRTSLLGNGAVRSRNFVETTAEELSAAIRRLRPNHNAAEPRHAFNTLLFKIPETLPINGGPGRLINEVHSFGMIFSGCFYDLLAIMFDGRNPKTEATLLTVAQEAMRLVVEGVRSAPIVPRFTQSVGRSMVLADQQINNGANRDSIREAFRRHGVELGANAMFASAAALAGPAPKGAKPVLSPATRKDLVARLGNLSGGRVRVGAVNIFGERMVRATQEREIRLDRVDGMLRGVTMTVEEPVFLGSSNGRASIVGHLPEPISTEAEVHAFARSLLSHNRIGLPKTSRKNGKKAGRGLGTIVTHEIRQIDGKKKLQRVRFVCGA